MNIPRLPTLGARHSNGLKCKRAGLNGLHAKLDQFKIGRITVLAPADSLAIGARSMLTA
jgi:hypothetical protein